MSKSIINESAEQNSLDQALLKAQKLFDDIKYVNPSYETISDRPSVTAKQPFGSDLSLSLKKKRDILVEPVIHVEDIMADGSNEENNSLDLAQIVNKEFDDAHDNDATILKTNRAIDIKNIDIEECKPKSLKNSDETKESKSSLVINKKSDYKNGSIKRSNLSLKNKGKNIESGYHWPLSPIRSILFFISLLLPVVISFLFIYVLPCPTDKVCIHNCPRNQSLINSRSNITSAHRNLGLLSNTTHLKFPYQKFKANLSISQNTH